MKKTKRPKRSRKKSKQVRKQLKDYIRNHHLAIISIFLSVSLSSIALLKSQHALRLTESWRDALSRTLEVISEGRVHPSRRDGKWGVDFKEKASMQLNFGVSASVVVIRANATLENEQVNTTENWMLKPN